MSALPVYREYPKMLTHPHYQPAIVSDDAAAGIWNVGHSARPGQAATFPPVTVNSPDQEEYYVSKGYTPGTATPPEEWQRRVVAPRAGPQVEYPRYSADGSVDYGPQGQPAVDRNYPKWVTRADGTQAIAQNAEHEAQLCPPRQPSDDEVRAELAEIEAKAAALRAKLGVPAVPSPVEPVAVRPVTLATRRPRAAKGDLKNQLIARAAKRGIAADRSWSIRGLNAAIAAAIAEARAADQEGAEHAVDTEGRDPAHQESVNAEG